MEEFSWDAQDLQAGRRLVGALLSRASMKFTTLLAASALCFPRALEPDGFLFCHIHATAVTGKKFSISMEATDFSSGASLKLIC